MGCDRGGGGELDTLFDRGFAALRRGRFVVLLLWAAGAGLGGWRIPHLIDNLEDKLVPPSGSQFMEAYRLLHSDGTWVDDPGMAAVLLQTRRPGMTLLDPDVPAAHVAGTVLNATARWSQFAVSALAGTWMNGKYYAVGDSPFRSLSPQLLSADHRSAVLLICCGEEFVDAVNRDGWVNGRPGAGDDRAFDLISIRATSVDKIGDSNGDAVTALLERMDIIGIPISLVVLGLRVQSLPLVIVPVVVLIVSLATAFGMLAAASEHVLFPQFSTALFMSICVAMSFDWSLFMLTRYRETRLRGGSNEEGVREALQYAGHTVLLSGLTIIAAYLSLVAIPVDFISAVGKGGALSLLACLMVSLTLTPALLLAAPCVGGAPPLCGLERRLPRCPAPRRAPCRRLGAAIAAAPLPVALAVVAAGAPLTYYATQLRLTVDQNQMHPTDTEVYQTWRAMSRGMGASAALGFQYPYTLCAVGRVGSDAFFNETNAVLDELTRRTALRASGIFGPTFAFGRPLHLAEAMDLLSCRQPGCSANPDGVLYRDFITQWPGRQGNPLRWATDQGLAVTTLAPPFDPQGSLAKKFIRDVRAVIDRPGAVRFVLGTGVSDRYDVEDAVWSRLPAVLGGCAAVLLVIVSAGMRSVVVGARLAVTVALTLSWVYGAGVVVFQTAAFTGASDRLSDIHAGGAEGAMFWMAPTLTFSIVLGLACDYDVFICSRVRELRRKGFSDRAAVLAAVDKTGSVVTCAGLIMVVTFGTMMLSSQTIIVEAGFFLAFGALIDTFVVRIVLVPALMLLLGRHNWWPSAMPPAVVDEWEPLIPDDDVGGGAAEAPPPGAEAPINKDLGTDGDEVGQPPAQID